MSDFSYTDTSAPIKNHRQFILPWVLLLSVVLLVGILRVRLLDVPLERDEGEDACMGQLMLHGIAPYTLAYNNKMPCIHAAYALIMYLFGQTARGIHIGLLIVSIFNVAFVFFMGQLFFDGFIASMAASSFALMALGQGVLGFTANAEPFVLFMVLPGIILLWYALEKQTAMLFFFSGLCLGLGFLMKQVGVYFIFFALVMIALRVILKKTRFPAMPVFILGVALPVTTVFLLVWDSGAFEKFWFFTVTIPRYEATILSLGQGLHRYFLNIVLFAAPLLLILVLMFIGLLHLLSGKRGFSGFFLTVFFVFALFSSSLGFYFRSHYFILVLPGLALLAGVGADWLGRALSKANPSQDARYFSLVLIVGALLVPIYMQRSYLFEWNPIEVSSRVYSRYCPFVVAQEIGQYVKEHTIRKEIVAVVGSEPEIYFYADRRPASPHIVTFFFNYRFDEDPKYSLSMQREMIQGIEMASPTYLVYAIPPLAWFHDPTVDCLVGWFAEYSQKYYDRVGFLPKKDALISSFIPILYKRKK